MKIDYLEDTVAYLVEERKERILDELYFNSFRTIKRVYIFEHFDEYARQLKSKREEVYWNASYYEKLIDYVKISIAFETFNKAVLLENGYLIHQIKKNPGNAALYNDQQKGVPVKIADFLQVSTTAQGQRDRKIFLTGLKDHFSTINYSLTLTANYQRIINLDGDLCYRLKRINDLRNKLHFFTEFKGAYEVNSHLNKWRYIKENAIATIKNKCDSLT